MSEIKIPKTFVVTKNRGKLDAEQDTWESTEKEQYAWGVGPGGDLMIFRAIYHSTFAVKMSDNDTKWFCYAAHTWDTVEVLRDTATGSVDEA